MKTQHGDRLPSKLKLYIGGAPFAPSYAVEWEGGTLKYRARSGEGGEAVREIVPTTDQWEAFWSALDHAGVWKWKTRYPNPGILDGTMWSIEIEREGRSISGRGDNASPRSFRTFVEAIRSLLGGLHFE
jgi:hypothetical protein